MQKTLREKDQGFTLIELLIVMIIIGILAAIAIPLFLSQQKKARDTSAKADGNTIAKEITSYYVDGTAGTSVATSGSTWTLSAAAAAVSSGILSKGNSATATGTSAQAYCVAVKTSDGNYWSYTQNGLNPASSTTAPGSC